MNGNNDMMNMQPYPHTPMMPGTQRGQQQFGQMPSMQPGQQQFGQIPGMQQGQQPFGQPGIQQPQQQFGQPGMQRRWPGMQINCRRLAREVSPAIEYGIDLARNTNCRRGIREATQIAYLMGRGYNFNRARRIVRQCERDDRYYSSKEE